MGIANGEVPIQYFQRRLLGGLLSLWLAFVVPAVVVMLVVPERLRPGAIILFAPLTVGFVVIRAYLNPARCPYCGASAEYEKDAHAHWRFKFPYGFAVSCHNCHADLTIRFQGGTVPSHSQAT